jgi:hypothetical protein
MDLWLIAQPPPWITKAYVKRCQLRLRSPNGGQPCWAEQLVIIPRLGDAGYGCISAALSASARFTTNSHIMNNEKISLFWLHQAQMTANAFWFWAACAAIALWGLKIPALAFILGCLAGYCLIASFRATARAEGCKE